MRAGGDDLVLPFRTITSRATGRLVRLGDTVDHILARHDYPDPVSHALGEALVLAALLGSGLKFESRLIVQTKTDGALDFLVADYVAPGKLRGYANFNKDDPRVAGVKGRGDQGALLGTGHVAMTIDPGGDMDRYQGIVALAGEPLVEAAHAYFRQSEQLPTFLRLAVARHYGPGADGAPGWRWRAGGLLVQHLSPEGGKPAGAEMSDEEHDASLEGDDDENWNRVRLLSETVEDHELLDPLLAPERLLYRLFHEEGVSVSPKVALVDECRCSRERLAGYLKGFGADELRDMREDDGAITVTCEFCSTKYRFEPDEIA